MSAGYYGAPVCKALCAATLGSTLLLSASTRRVLSLDVAALLSRGELWRLFTSSGPFGSTSELVLGLMLLYNFRVFERLLGSEKFGAFVFYVTSLATSLQAGVTVTLSSRVIGGVPATGPYSLIGALFVLHQTYIPVHHPRMFGLFGVDFTNKAWCYAAGVPLLFSQGFRSLLPGACGAFAGWLYVNDMMSLQAFRLPGPVNRAFRLLAPLVADSPPRAGRTRPRGARPRGIDDARGGGGGGGGGGVPPVGMPDASALPNVPLQPPSEEDVATLMSMGFDREPAQRALERSGNNVQVAADRLLTGTY